MSVRIGLNGFGRIGRAFTRIAAVRNSFQIVTVNT
ncbi:MAG: glyceraldehyde 3-phosphate dehydrogenase NAD-binding domain-containing protein, partial [Candidatus Paceibacterota bacterium]